MESPSSFDSPLLSPAKARRAAIQAKDWAYVTSWLSRQYAPNLPPDFERNEDTLRTLLALAAANDAADEEAMILHRAREEAVQAYKMREANEDSQKKEILDEVQMCLGEKGRECLDDLAETTAILGALRPQRNEIGQAILELTREEFEVQSQVTKIEALRGYLERELADLRQQLKGLKSNKAYDVPSELPALTAEWSRSTKLLTAKLGEYQDKSAMLERNSTKGPTIEELVLEEEDFIRLKDTVEKLEKRVRLFHCLPKNLTDARSEYQKLEREYRQLVQKRDTMFENLRAGKTK
ncbi:hypothetical protein ASPZODRAFT_60533 [Penicilliopsis zonata CBS 506.65]|uniref:Uncharacterized protein n=1 Tax=Penicilliopsis zonata CBS 506.65 TaxID=1073090 RepID=A0A1L9SQ05_9EURO|nr:hypothetical protein ASPZODRAFT_60533 [Penicilliopsis zonata CBS 506.65]OJJ49191.1 hypothetical protein ASPZODRAFT_60533 [Penicilliopsis zonata CBS 506.65]